MKKSFDDFFKHYLICALWSSTDTDDEDNYFNFDDYFDVDSFEENSLKDLREEAKRFYDENNHLFLYKNHTCSDGTYTDDMLAGHDFWLTRNGHGAGFWDHDMVNQDDAELLSERARAYGFLNLEASSDMKEVRCYVV